MEDTRTQPQAEQAERLDVMVLLSDFWRAFKKMFWVAIVGTLVLSLFLAVRTRMSWSPRYEASATFVISLSTDYGTSSRYYTSATAEQMEKTFPYILKSGILNSIVANDLGLPYVPGSISASSVPSTGLFTLRVQSSDPQTAYDVLQSVMRNYPQVAAFVVGDTVLTMIGETGVPTAPCNTFSYGDSFKKGLLGGVALCVGCCLAYAFLYRTVRRPEDIRKMLNVRCLGTIPHVQMRKMKKEQHLLLSDSKVPVSFRESLRRLRSRVEKSGAHTVLITSALAGEGKTTMAVNLALSLAEKGHFVLLMDCDLRNPSVEKVLGTSHRFGVSDYLEGRAEFTQIGFVLSEYSNFAVIPAGRSLQNASERMDTTKMNELLEQAREMADYVILDCAPSAFLTDAAVMARYADAALMVVRYDYAAKDRILTGVESLTDSGVQLMGCVLNDLPKGSVSGGGYYGGYGYGYGYSSYGSTYGESK